MPQIKFTDTTIGKLKVDAITWYSDPTAKGLQLCATPAGVRTWYVVKWDPASQKTRPVGNARDAHRLGEGSGGQGRPRRERG
jgi:hypothetical protein